MPPMELACMRSGSSVGVLLAAFCTCSVFSQLALVEGSAGPSSAGKAVPVPSRVVATATYEYDGKDRKLQLAVVREPPTAERPGFRHRYRITDEVVSSTGSLDLQTVVDLPDIPTHDPMDAGVPQRSGALFIDSSSDVVYAVLLKISGSSAIVRVYEIRWDHTDVTRPNFQVTQTAPIQIEQHLPFTDVDVSLEVSEVSDNKLNIDLKRTDTGQQLKSLAFDRKAKRLHKEAR